MITPETIGAIRDLQEERLKLTIQKNTDYSGKVDNIKLCGIEGIAIRIFDKACRLLTISNKAHSIKVDETIQDTLKDLANYADYGNLLLRGQWDIL